MYTPHLYWRYTHAHTHTHIHYITKSMWTLARQTSHSKMMGINMGLVPPFAAITAFTLLVRLSTRHFWNITVGPCFHSATRALVRLATDVGRLGLTRSQRSNSSQRCSMGLRSGLCLGQSSSSTPISTNYFCMDIALCTRVLSCWNRKGPSPNKVGSTKSSSMP